MKFLIIATRRQQMPAPPEALPAIFRSQRDWVREHVDDGTFDVIYGFPYGGGVAIANADSAEELNSALMFSPAFWLNDWDVRPLLDIDTLLENIAQAVERTAGVPA
jgi:dienelactone hydrolase